MPLNIQACTSNNENGGCGPMVASQIREELTKLEDGADVFIINCQEANLDKTKQELEASLGNQFIVKTSVVKKAPTKFEKINPLSKTGMGTVVVYLKEGNVKQLEIDPQNRNAAGTNKGKGGQVNTIYITDKESNNFTVQSTTGHLDSNNVKKRMSDYRSIRQQQFFDAKSWQELCRKTPHLSIDGMDINTRSVLKKSPVSTGTLNDDCYENLWEIERNDPRIAAIFLASGGTRYSGHSTYKTPKIGSEASHVVKVESKNLSESDKRFGDVNTGSLDHITVVNATDTHLEMVPEDKKKYVEAKINIGLEAGQTRDHHFLSTGNIRLGVVNDYDRVRNYVALQLAHAAPSLSEEIQAKLREDNPNNRFLLQKIHQEYLSPEGKLIQMIKYDAEAKRVVLPESLQSIPGLNPLFSVTHALEKLSELNKDLEEKEKNDDIERQLSDIEQFMSNPPQEADTKPWFSEVTLNQIQAEIQKMPSVEKIPNIEKLEDNLLSKLQILSSFYKEDKKYSSEETTASYFKIFLMIQSMTQKLSNPNTNLDDMDLSKLREGIENYKKISKDAKKITIMNQVLEDIDGLEAARFQEEIRATIHPESKDPIMAGNEEFDLDMDDVSIPPSSMKANLWLLKAKDIMTGWFSKATKPEMPRKPDLNEDEKAVFRL